MPGTNGQHHTHSDLPRRGVDLPRPAGDGTAGGTAGKTSRSVGLLSMRLQFIVCKVMQREAYFCANPPRFALFLLALTSLLLIIT